MDRVIQQVRSISHLLHPPLLDEVGLVSALSWLLDGLAKRSGIEASLDVQPSQFPRLAPELEKAVFRIVQEAVMNVLRHSSAKNGWVTLKRHSNQLVITAATTAKALPKESQSFSLVASAWV